MVSKQKTKVLQEILKITEERGSIGIYGIDGITGKLTRGSLTGIDDSSLLSRKALRNIQRKMNGKGGDQFRMEWHMQEGAKRLALLRDDRNNPDLIMVDRMSPERPELVKVVFLTGSEAGRRSWVSMQKIDDSPELRSVLRYLKRS